MLSMDRSTTGLNVRFLSVRSLLARPQWQVDGQYFQPAGDPASSTCTIARGYWRENTPAAAWGKGAARARHTPISPPPHPPRARGREGSSFFSALLFITHPTHPTSPLTPSR